MTNQRNPPAAETNQRNPPAAETNQRNPPAAEKLQNPQIGPTYTNIEAG